MFLWSMPVMSDFRADVRSGNRFDPKDPSFRAVLRNILPQGGFFIFPGMKRKRAGRPKASAERQVIVSELNCVDIRRVHFGFQIFW